MKSAKNVSHPPVTRRMSGLHLVENRKQALVVAADYMALTCKNDRNVIFWTANDADEKNIKIPKTVTHLWLAPDLLLDVRTRLLEQAEDPDREQSIEVWDCGLFELRRRLLPIWYHNFNRSLVDVVPEGGIAIVEGSSRLDLVKEAAERYRKGLSFKVDLLAPISRRPRAATSLPQTESALSSKPKVTHPPNRGLAELSLLERKIYHDRFGSPSKTIMEISTEYGVPARNVEKILDRCLLKLHPADLDKAQG